MLDCFLIKWCKPWVRNKNACDPQRHTFYHTMQVMQNIDFSAIVCNSYDHYFKHPTTEWHTIHVLGVLGVKAWMSNYMYILCSFVKMLSNKKTGLSNSKHSEAGTKIPHFCRQRFRIYFHWRSLHLYSISCIPWVRVNCNNLGRLSAELLFKMHLHIYVSWKLVSA